MSAFILHTECYIYLADVTIFLLVLDIQFTFWLLKMIDKFVVSLHKCFFQMNWALDWDILIAIIWITNSKFWKWVEGSMWLTAVNEAITWLGNISCLEQIISKCKSNWFELSIFFLDI